MTVLAALALLHPDQQTLAVDIADLQRDHFGRAQPGTVGNAQRRLVLEAGGRDPSATPASITPRLSRQPYSRWYQGT
jgi:hypothetical protein